MLPASGDIFILEKGKIAGRFFRKKHHNSAGFKGWATDLSN